MPLEDVIAKTTCECCGSCKFWSEQSARTTNTGDTALFGRCGNPEVLMEELNNTPGPIIVKTLFDFSCNHYSGI
jgi:predicted nucleic-acid-binding Zn-ribbon protein